MNNTAAEPPRRKGIRKLLHRWKEKIQAEKKPKSQRAVEPTKKPTIQKRSQPAKTPNPRRNTAPADLLSSHPHPSTVPSKPGIASPTPSAPAPKRHQNRRATTGYFTASDVRAQIAADEALLRRRAAEFEYHHQREPIGFVRFDHAADRAIGGADISPSGTGPVKQWPWGK
ncbi:hypothetical protein BU16DRAFT_523119 [Lophium mytilinum]|uniref:Uncharacterized protein n=1 Tax=Lophium mytilinum TaxID=390894 RepID=A0A6A6R6C9_9PEZI|nr:hypothetical protein BU16DRAFT_523119 [Lophium mytilinum]